MPGAKENKKYRQQVLQLKLTELPASQIYKGNVTVSRFLLQRHLI